MRFLKQLTINLDALPAYVEFNSEWTERLDKQICRLILQTDDPRVNDKMKAHFLHTFNLIKEDGTLKVKYQARPFGNGLGRRYADELQDHSYWGNLTIHSKYIKNTIFAYLGWRDYDQRKGHPTILAEIGRRNGNPLTAYEEYVAEGGFDAICEELIPYYSVEGETPLTRDDIKDLFNSTIYGGGHTGWVKNITWSGLSADEIDKKEIKGKKPKEMRNKQTKHPFYERFLADTQFITRRIYDANPALVARVRGTLPDDSNKEFSYLRNRVMSYFCGVLENEITFQAYKYCVDNGLAPKRGVDWGYDGFTTPPPPPYTDDSFHLNAMNEFVRERTGFKMVTIELKEIKPETIIQSVIDARRAIVVVANPIAPVVFAENVEGIADETESVATNVILSGIIDDDNEGANLIFQHIKDRFKFCYGNIFFKQRNVWVSSKDTVDKHLLHFILNKTDLKQLSKGKNPQPRPYSTNVSGANALRTALYAKLVVEGEDNTLLAKFITTTRGRLCFADGVLDMTEHTGERKGRFYAFDEEGNVPFEYYTPVQIERNFAEYFDNPDMALCSHIEDKVFRNLFGVDCDKALKFLSRGVAGHFEDKAWSLYIGNRNCGKGVVDCLAESGIGSYKANVEAQNLLCNANRSLKQDTPERQMAFALDFQFARLCFSQELPPPDKKKNIKVNADIIKKLCSGGDKLKGKRNYDIYITEFINMARLIVMCNDCPTLTNDDALQTCCEFNSTISFKTQEEIDSMIAKGEDALILQKYKVGDPKIKDDCRTVDWGNAFVMLMIENYQDFAVPCIDPPILVGGVAEEEEKEEVVDLRKFIITEFIITNNQATDFLKSDAIQEVFEEKNFGDISAKKIAIELKAIGLKNGKKGGARGWFGIQNKPKEYTDENGNAIDNL